MSIPGLQVLTRAEAQRRNSWRSYRGALFAFTALSAVGAGGHALAAPATSPRALHCTAAPLPRARGLFNSAHRKK